MDQINLFEESKKDISDVVQTDMLDKLDETQTKQTGLSITIESTYHPINSYDKFVDEIINLDDDIIVKLETNMIGSGSGGSIPKIDYSFIKKEKIIGNISYQNIVKFTLDNLDLDHGDSINLRNRAESLEKSVVEKMSRDMNLTSRLRTEVGTDYLKVYSPVKDFKKERK